jgi:hypothetical protein
MLEGIHHGTRDEDRVVRDTSKRSVLRLFRRREVVVSPVMSLRSISSGKGLYLLPLRNPLMCPMESAG